MHDETRGPTLESSIAMDSENITVRSMQSPRSHLLLSCGSSILAIAQKTYRRIEEMNGPVGWLARRAASMAAPILNPLQLKCFSVLSFIDRQIIAIQDITMVVFPPSACIFWKVDELVILADSLPKKFDDAIDGLRVVMGEVMSSIIDLITDRNESEEGDIIKDIECEEVSKEDIIGEGERFSPRKELKLEGLKQDSNGERKHWSPGKESRLTEMTDYDDEEGMWRKTVEDEIKEVEKSCKDIMEALESMEIVTVETHAGGRGAEEERGDPRKHVAGSADEERDIIRDIECDVEVRQDSIRRGEHLGASNERTDNDDKEDVHHMTMGAEIDQNAESSCKDTVNKLDSMKTPKVESHGGGNVAGGKGSPRKKLAASAGEECAEWFKQDGKTMADEIEEVGSSSKDVIEAFKSMEIVKVESQEGGHRERGSIGRKKIDSLVKEGKTVGVISKGSMDGRDKDLLLDLFDQAWQLKRF